MTTAMFYICCYKHVKIMDKWNYDKRVRELSQEIEQYKIHAKREIENNKVCHPSKVRDNSQRSLEICKQRYKDFTGEDYE